MPALRMSVVTLLLFRRIFHSLISLAMVIYIDKYRKIQGQRYHAIIHINRLSSLS